MRERGEYVKGVHVLRTLSSLNLTYTDVVLLDPSYLLVRKVCNRCPYYNIRTFYFFLCIYGMFDLYTVRVEEGERVEDVGSESLDIQRVFSSTTE